MKKLARLIESENCDAESERFSETNKIKNISKNKTLIKKINNCKPFIGVSILFVCVSKTLTGIMIYFYLKAKNISLY